MASMSMFGEPIMNYSVTYQRSSGGVLVTVNSPSTSATLQGLVPNAEYNVSVAGINSCGGTSPYISTAFALQGRSLFKSSIKVTVWLKILAGRYFGGLQIICHLAEFTLAVESVLFIMIFITKWLIKRVGNLTGS